MTKEEALKLALEALENIKNDPFKFDLKNNIDKAITAIKEALAQREQPKVRTGNCLRVGVCASEGHKIAPQRTWVGLTDEEVTQIIEMGLGIRDSIETALDKLKEKND